MNLESVKAVVTSKAARQLLLTKKHSPKILFVTGTIGVISATVLACRATLRVSDILDHHEIDKKLLKGEYPATQDAVEDVDTQVRKLQIKAAAEIIKLYALPVGLGLASIGALTGSHVVLTKRNAGVMAAYAALDRGFKEYRQRVAMELGPDTDRKFASGAETIEIEEKLADGKTKVTTKDVVKAGKSGPSPYAAIFDENSRMYSREPGRNALTLGLRQSQANDKLRAQGHLFLNEVHDLLGLPRTKVGAQVGWIWRRESEEKTGDNYVDFGIFMGDDVERVDAFVYGDENSVWLDFNVDGLILDLI